MEVAPKAKTLSGIISAHRARFVDPSNALRLKIGQVRGCLLIGIETLTKRSTKGFCFDSRMTISLK
jgi:hypothetical protein